MAIRIVLLWQDTKEKKSMNRIQDAFQNGKAFIPFITCGYPSLEISEQIIYEMEANGADIIELGIPFSDPTAEGATIQAANKCALDNGITTDAIFEMVERVRARSKIPLVFMTYANVVFSYGSESFISKASKLGIDGLILPDVPYEEKDEFEPICTKHNLSLISLIAPTSNERIEMIAKDAKGFIYCVSSLGVTGVRQNITTNLESIIAQIKHSSTIPVAVGFGIQTPAQAREVAQYADGVIVGSAIIKLCMEHQKQAIKPIGKYVKQIKEAIHKNPC